MERFNEEKPLRRQITLQIERYFRYRWEKNRNQAIEGDEDYQIFIQLPPMVQMSIFSDYLYHDFLQHYGCFFM